MEPKQLETLLTQVQSLSSHYKKIDELTGENFNVFRILKMDSSEVRLHSAFLAALLDPKGSHGQKDIFLKLFIQNFCFKGNQIDPASCEVEIEKHTGTISDDGTEGGRIDILIKDTSGYGIVIENKIYAGDQWNQMLRYKSAYPNADLLYLTLNGKEPDENSIGGLKIDEHFKCISYKSHILTWLEECRKEVAVYPIVRESITQYINLIKYLTNQTKNHAMQAELDKILQGNLEASFTIANGLDESLDNLLKNKFLPNLDLALKQINPELTFTNTITAGFEKNYTGVFIYKNKWKHISIGFQFQKYDKDMIYGIVAKKDSKILGNQDDLRKKLEKIKGTSKSSWWPTSNKVDGPYSNWGEHKAWEAIISGDMLTMMVGKISGLLNEIKKIGEDEM